MRFVLNFDSVAHVNCSEVSQRDTGRIRIIQDWTYPLHPCGIKSGRAEYFRVQ
jgi:hypothetical protein